MILAKKIETPNAQKSFAVRFTPEQEAKIARVKAQQGFRTKADAVRWIVDQCTV